MPRYPADSHLGHRAPRHFRVADPPDTPKASGREIRSSSVLHEYRCPANEKAASIWLHFERFSYILPIASAHPFHAPGSRPVCTAKKPDNVLKIRHKAKSLFLGQPSARLLPFAEPLTRAGTVLKTWKIHPNCLIPQNKFNQFFPEFYHNSPYIQGSRSQATLLKSSVLSKFLSIFFQQYLFYRCYI